MNSQNNEPDKKPNLESMEDSVGSIKEKAEPDKYDRTEDVIVKEIDQAKKREEITDIQFDRELKGKYADKLFCFLVIYTGVVLLAVGLQGIGMFCLHYVPLSLLISSIAVMTIGVGRFVVKSLDRRNLSRDESATLESLIQKIINFFNIS
ncbi:MAG: hypothetical protein OXU76_03145 [Alphaproteobacteria bacterium]|nr:hypothetical protein [Alphaproteobacteria bacterium]